jgi:hypothetical protein
MNKTETQHNWADFLKLFSRQNKLRPTRIGVFEGAPDALTDYWVEDGLPLEGIDVDTSGSDAPSVEIMLGSMEKPGLPGLTHTIAKTRYIRIILSADGESDGLDIENDEGSTTTLRFENRI